MFLEKDDLSPLDIVAVGYQNATSVPSFFSVCQPDIKIPLFVWTWSFQIFWVRSRTPGFHRSLIFYWEMLVHCCRLVVVVAASKKWWKSSAAFFPWFLQAFLPELQPLPCCSFWFSVWYLLGWFLSKFAWKRLDSGLSGLARRKFLELIHQTLPYGYFYRVFHSPPPPKKLKPRP